MPSYHFLETGKSAALWAVKVRLDWNASLFFPWWHDVTALRGYPATEDAHEHYSPLNRTLVIWNRSHSISSHRQSQSEFVGCLWFHSSCVFVEKVKAWHIGPWGQTWSRAHKTDHKHYDANVSRINSDGWLFDLKKRFFFGERNTYSIQPDLNHLNSVSQDNLSFTDWLTGCFDEDGDTTSRTWAAPLQEFDNYSP